MADLVGPTSGNPWVDTIVTVGAVVAALYVLYSRIIRPIVHAATKVTEVFDLAADMPPSVTNVLLALPAQVQEIHDRIDEHMDREEQSFDTLSSDMASMRVVLDERTTMLNTLNDTMQTSQRTLNDHIANDEERFQNSRIALDAAQRDLLSRLDEIPTRRNP